MSHTRRLACLGLLLVSARVEARGCREVSQIVGEQRCERFGSWDVSKSHAWISSLGPSFEINPLAGSHFSVSATDAQGSVHRFSVAGRDLQDRNVAVAPLTMRVTMFPSRVFYLGGEVLCPGSIGFASGASHPSSDANATNAALAVHSDGFFMMSLGAVAGASLPVGRFDLSVELFGGFRAITPDLQFNDQAAAAAALGGCPSDAKQKSKCPGTDGNSWSVDARLEPRVGIAVWLSRDMTVRVLAGFDALADRAIHVGAMIEFHTRSYDGFFPRPSYANTEPDSAARTLTLDGPAR